MKRHIALILGIFLIMTPTVTAWSQIVYIRNFHFSKYGSQFGPDTGYHISGTLTDLEEKDNETMDFRTKTIKDPEEGYYNETSVTASTNFTASWNYTWPTCSSPDEYRCVQTSGDSLIAESNITRQNRAQFTFDNLTAFHDRSILGAVMNVKVRKTGDMGTAPLLIRLLNTNESYPIDTLCAEMWIYNESLPTTNYFTHFNISSTICVAPTWPFSISLINHWEAFEGLEVFIYHDCTGVLGNCTSSVQIDEIYLEAQTYYHWPVFSLWFGSSDISDYMTPLNLTYTCWRLPGTDYSGASMTNETFYVDVIRNGTYHGLGEICSPTANPDPNDGYYNITEWDIYEGKIWFVIYNTNNTGDELRLNTTLYFDRFFVYVNNTRGVSPIDPGSALSWMWIFVFCFILTGFLSTGYAIKKYRDGKE